MWKGIIRSADDVSGAVWGKLAVCLALGHGSWRKRVENLTAPLSPFEGWLVMASGEQDESSPPLHPDAPFAASL